MQPIADTEGVIILNFERGLNFEFRERGGVDFKKNYYRSKSPPRYVHVYN
jgi:hypothetical protein